VYLFIKGFIVYQHKISRILSLVIALFLTLTSQVCSSSDYDFDEQIRRATEASLRLVARDNYGQNDNNLGPARIDPVILQQQEILLQIEQRNREAQLNAIELVSTQNDAELARLLQLEVEEALAQEKRAQNDAALALLMQQEAEEALAEEKRVQNDATLALLMQQEAEQAQAEARRVHDDAEIARLMQEESDARAHDFPVGNNNNNGPLLAPVPNFHRANHISAIGQVVTGKHCGTATLIESGQFNILSSAAHVFHNVLPRADSLGNVKSGPLYVDLSKLGVFWFHEPVGGAATTRVPVLGMVACAEYIHLISQKKSKDFSEAKQKYDVVFLLLDPRYMPAQIPTIPLMTSIPRFRQMCALVGYGQLANAAQAQRHHITLPLRVDSPKVDWDTLAIKIDEFPSDFESARDEISALLCKSVLHWKDGLASGSPPGDSGGPCMVIDDKGQVCLAGILSVYGTYDPGEIIHYDGFGNEVRRERAGMPYDYNGIVSLFRGDPVHGYNICPGILAMVQLLKQNAA
jgi:hypothetical protein